MHRRQTCEMLSKPKASTVADVTRLKLTCCAIRMGWMHASKEREVLSNFVHTHTYTHILSLALSLSYGNRPDTFYCENTVGQKHKNKGAGIELKVVLRLVDRNLTSNSLGGFRVPSYNCTAYRCLQF